VASEALEINSNKKTKMFWKKPKLINPKLYQTISKDKDEILRCVTMCFQQRCSIKSKMHGGKMLVAERVKEKGRNLIHDPVFNKGLAFPVSERDRLGIRGLIPSTMLSLSEQETIIMEEYRMGWAERALREPDDEIIKSGVNPDNIRKWKVLQSVQDRNETLFYKILMDHFFEMAPIIYTPTVGWACSHFSALLRRPRGMFIGPADRGEMASIVYNWDSEDVNAIVVTDGSRVLGLGDQGLGGMGISIGKLDLYVAAGGFHPKRVLPVVLDIGTNNPKLLNDPNYLGIKQKRMEGEEYMEFIDEFMAACKLRWPKVLLQMEDFQSNLAVATLKRYKDEYLMFNDDIQGTAATVLAGLYGAMKVLGLPPEGLCEQRFVVCGAGSAGIGVTLTILHAIKSIKSYKGKSGPTAEEAENLFHIVDDRGLVTKARTNLAEMDKIIPDISSVASRDIHMEGTGLADVVKSVKPTILIGLSGCGGLFNEEILTEMNKNCPQPPVIFSLSNPTSRSECTAEQAQRFTNGRAIFASGSPFADVPFDPSIHSSHEGFPHESSSTEQKVIASSQCNNRYIFPGLALGAVLGQTGRVSQAMFNKSSEALFELVSDEDLARRATFPENVDIREVSCHLAARVIEQALGEPHGRGVKVSNQEARVAYTEDGLEGLKAYIFTKMWDPFYKPLIQEG